MAALSPSVAFVPVGSGVSAMRAPSVGDMLPASAQSSRNGLAAGAMLTTGPALRGSVNARAASDPSAGTKERVAVTVAGALAAGVPLLAARNSRRHRRGLRRRAEKIVRFEANQDSESVLELAKKSNIRLEVRPWEMLTNIAKDAARGWFVKRAEERGIAWTESVDSMVAQQEQLEKLYKELEDPTIQYPAYYTQPFHGYGEGNLSWKAAHELHAATQSMCLSYYEGVPNDVAQEKYRGAARDAVKAKWQSLHGEERQPTRLLDVGCSGGFSTSEMAKAFPDVQATGIDLSPHFLAVASITYPEFKFEHRMAEATKFEDESFDVVTLNFLLHECPRETSQQILKEAYRVLKPGGVLSVLDVDPRRLLELPPLRRWAFQVTEPWCKAGEYYSLDATEYLSEIGFEGVAYNKNDPVNSCWLASKPAKK
eukprot:TRINITY_DN17673_c0_g1_i1.p1 TRINITY_DN17673_c0_g1~~TRINITY_DN17673_c0_g1_i1.p1  ORF type:complete len:426 (+),score=101.18 TRINITY_DN17673_c0_g1_i1:113-1390(+)